MTNEQRAQTHNAEVAAEIASGQIVRLYLGGTKIHGSSGETVRGHSGHVHHRALCQRHTPRSYASRITDQSREITCLRCLASLETRS